MAQQIDEANEQSNRDRLLNHTWACWMDDVKKNQESERILRELDWHRRDYEQGYALEGSLWEAAAARGDRDTY